jgi:hypothetical protein
MYAWMTSLISWALIRSEIFNGQYKILRLQRNVIAICTFVEK